jgi:hypothetical protein
VVLEVLVCGAVAVGSVRELQRECDSAGAAGVPVALAVEEDAGLTGVEAHVADR